MQLWLLVKNKKVFRLFFLLKIHANDHIIIYDRKHLRIGPIIMWK